MSQNSGPQSEAAAKIQQGSRLPAGWQHSNRLNPRLPPLPQLHNQTLAPPPPPQLHNRCHLQSWRNRHLPWPLHNRCEIG